MFRNRGTKWGAAMLRPSFNLTPMAMLLAGGVVLVTAGLLATPYYYLAVAVAPGALFVALLFRFPWLTVFLIILMVPFDAFREFGGISVGKLAGVLALGIAFLLMLFGQIPLRQLFSNIWLYLLPFLVINVIAAMFSHYQEVSVDGLRQFAIAYVTVALVLLFIDKESVVERLLDLIVLSVAMSGFLSVAGYFFDIPMLAMGLDEDSLKRGTGGAKDPNVFGSLVVFSLPLVAHRISVARNGLVRFFFVGVLLLDLLAVALSQSRGATLVLLLTLLLIAWEHRHIFTLRRVGIVLLLATISAGATAVTLPESYWDRLSSLVEANRDRSLGRRFSYLLVAWESFVKSPVIGHGPDTFPERYAESGYGLQFVTSKDEGVHRHAHNTYLEVLIGSGLLGLLVFIGFFARIFLNFVEAARRFRDAGKPDQASLSRAYMLAFAGLSIYLLIISQITLKYIWLVAGVSWVLVRLARNTEPLPEAGETT